MEAMEQLEYLIKKLGRDTIIYFPAKILPGLATILLTAIFTRVFKPEVYGQFIIIITTTAIVTAIFSQWLSQAILRYRAQYTANKMGHFFSVNLIKILILLSTSLVLLFLVFYPFKKILHQYERFYLISLLIILADLWFTVFLTVFQADTKANIFTLYNILNASFKLGFSLFLVFVVKMDVFGLLLSAFMSSFVLILPMIKSLISATNAFHEHSVTRGGKDLFFSLLKQFIAYGFPMVGWFIGTELLMVSDRYFLQFFRGSDEVGIYSTNYSLVSSAISFITIPLLNAAHPLIMKANVDASLKIDEVKKLIGVFSRYFLLLVYPTTTYLVLFKDELVQVFLGAEYRTGSIIFPILAPGIFLWFFAMFGHKALELREKTSRMFLYVVICTIIKLILNLLFIPHYGYMGAAMTTLICLSLYPMMVYWGTKNEIEWTIPWITLIRLVIVFVVLTGIVYITKYFIAQYIITLIVGATITVMVYALMLSLLKELRPYEMKALKMFLKKPIRSYVNSIKNL